MQELKLVSVDDPPNEQCPTRRSHPFWKSVIGSTLTLEMITPPESQLKSLCIRVYSMSLPTIYQLSAVYSGGKRDTMYCHDWEARAIIKNEWLKHYRARTRIIYSPHAAVDMSKFVTESSPRSTDSTQGSPRSTDNSFDSSPRRWLSPRGGDSSNNSSPGNSPRGRDWFKKRLSLPPLAAINGADGDDSAPTSPTSPLTASPRRWFLKRSPSGGGGGLASSPRPKTPSPRSPKLTRSANSPMFRELLDKTRERYSNKQ